MGLKKQKDGTWLLDFYPEGNLRVKQVNVFEKASQPKVRPWPLSVILLKILITHLGYAAFRSIIKRAEIELPDGQSSHVLHHTFASHFMMNGGNILVLQRILGHTDIKMTMRYAHFAPDHFDDAMRLNPLVRTI